MRNQEVRAKLTREERDALKGAAERVGMTVAVFLRQVIRREVGLPTSVEAKDTNETERET